MSAEEEREIELDKVFVKQYAKHLARYWWVHALAVGVFIAVFYFVWQLMQPCTG